MVGKSDIYKHKHSYFEYIQLNQHIRWKGEDPHHVSDVRYLLCVLTNVPFVLQRRWLGLSFDVRQSGIIVPFPKNERYSNSK